MRNLYTDLRTAIIHYLDDKVPVSVMKQGPPRSTTNMVQTLSTEDQGERGEDAEMPKNEIFAMPSSTGRVKAKARAKERRENAGTVVKVIITAETARMTNHTPSGQMVGNGRFRKATRQAKMQAKDGMQARAIGTSGEIVRAEAKTGMGMASPTVRYDNINTADHNVLNEGSESRNNHRNAVVVQDLATQWIQSYPCKTKASQETEKSLRKFLEPSEKPKVIKTNNFFGKACEDLSWNHCTSTLHRSVNMLKGKNGETRALLKSRKSSCNLTKPTKNPKPNENVDHDQERRPVPFRNTGVAARIQRKSCG